MNPIVKLSVIALLVAACTACSHNEGAAPPAASVPAAPAASTPAPPASAIPMHAPAASASSAPMPAGPTRAPSSNVILQRPQRPDFAQAFAAMDGASALPAWVKHGGTSTPPMNVRVKGRTMWLSHVCKTADCQGDQLFLLTDPTQHTMQGLFVEPSGKPGAAVRKLTWLGKPDAAARTFLEAQISGS